MDCNTFPILSHSLFDPSSSAGVNEFVTCGEDKARFCMLCWLCTYCFVAVLSYRGESVILVAVVKNRVYWS